MHELYNNEYKHHSPARSYTFANGPCEACSSLMSDDDLELADEYENDDDTVAVQSQMI